METQFQKTCPKCQCIQVFTDKYHLQRALNTKSLCRDCSKHLPSKKRQNLIGNIYGHLKIVSLVEQRHGHQYWKCICDCGNETVVKHTHLTGHTIRSCGCVHLYLQEKHPHWKGIGKISGAYIYQVKKSAEKRNLFFQITKEEMWKKFLDQDGRCALTGVELLFDSELRKRDGNASLDRVDSSKGYAVDNVQWIHKVVNIMKQDLPEKELIKWCQLIARRSI